MNPLFRAALEIQGFFHAHKWRFCFIGGLTVLRWGEVRTTQDVDVSLMTSFGEEVRYIETILAGFEPRFPDAGSFALETRTLLVKAANDVDIDISLAAFPFEEEVIRRASFFSFDQHCKLLTCSAEDLLIYKVFAGRDRDWVDVKGILKRQKGSLDWSQIEAVLPELCEIKGASENLERLRDCRMVKGD